MLALSSILSQYAKRLCENRWTTNPQRRARRRRGPLNQQHFVAAEILEERTLLSAAPVFDSAMSIGNGTGVSQATAVAVDGSGNSYMTGSFSGTVDFNPNGTSNSLTARGAEDVFVAKYNSTNSLVWVQRMGGDAPAVSYSATDIGRSIKVDVSGNVYVVGSFFGSADFGSTNLSTAGDMDGFVEKLSAGGTVQWAKSWGLASGVNDFGGGVGIDGAGNVYAVGNTSGGPNTGYNILKYSSTGSAVWSESVFTHAIVGADKFGLAVDASGNVFLSGSFQGTVDFNPGPQTVNITSSGTNQTSGFVLKLDTKGKFGWVSPFLGQTVGSTSGGANATSVALDGSGNVVVGGSYRNSVDFDPGNGITALPTTGGGFITKLNSNGGLIWARALERSGGSTSVYGLAVDSANNIYATGLFSGTIDLDPSAGTDSHTSAGARDIFVVKLDAAGNYGWGDTFGGTGDEGYPMLGNGGPGIAVDSSGTVYISGAYQATVDFDPALTTYNLTTPGTYSNAFLLKLKQV